MLSPLSQSVASGSSSGQKARVTWAWASNARADELAHEFVTMSRERTGREFDAR